MTHNIKTVAVAGAGTMGAGIAIVAARAGFDTYIYDTNQGALDRARQQGETFLRKSVERGKLTPQQFERAMTNWKGTTQIEDLSNSDIVIEAIFEDLTVKRNFFTRLNEKMSPDCLFASNTSTISISEIAGGSGRPAQFVGMHFCLPAQLMKLVEMSAGLTTTEETFQRAWDFCTALGQQPVKTEDTPGFILNYFLIPFNNDAIRLVEQGVAEPSEIDVAIKGALGYPMGPLELLDLVGLDTQRLLCEAMFGLTYESRAACPPLVKRMIAAGRIGKKVGRGFHNYGDSKIFGA
jgi:3-hydroxybutyryl-CoA dehydrogenase